ncbi:unnamed protein product [Staurois parvus]|uniref:Uncharacterized protein n=1 Tax=Staurois parvus TaxID=386267 RepID=A0ABN9D699_9NEOB|nr:unnamed protein product [Staurois parvus]
MCKMPKVQSILSGDKRWSLEKREEQRRKDQKPFYTMQKINPSGSTVSITSIYRLILLLWV